MTFETRFAHFTADEYFADPCAVPSLSSSIANVLETQSALHAWSQHPKLGGVARAGTKAQDNGSLSHTLLLGAGKEVEIIDAADYRTNAAKAAREAARAAGKIPVLADEYKAASATAAILRERFAALGIVLEGEREATALWTETATNGEQVQCRGMMDHLKLPVAHDLKSIRSANPATCRRHVESYGYAIQRAAYVSAIERIRPEFAGRVDFVFVFYELEAPHVVTPIRLSGAFRELGERGWRRAVDRWEECLRLKAWPAYTDGVLDLEPSPWALKNDMDRQLGQLEGASIDW